MDAVITHELFVRQVARHRARISVDFSKNRKKEKPRENVKKAKNRMNFRRFFEKSISRFIFFRQDRNFGENSFYYRPSVKSRFFGGKETQEKVFMICGLKRIFNKLTCNTRSCHLRFETIGRIPRSPFHDYANIRIEPLSSES